MPACQCILQLLGRCVTGFGSWPLAQQSISSSQQDCQLFTDKQQKFSAHPIMRSVVACVLLVCCLWSVQAAQTLQWTSGIATFTGSEVSQLEQPALGTRAAAGGVSEQDNATITSVSSFRSPQLASVPAGPGSSLNAQITHLMAVSASLKAAPVQRSCPYSTLQPLPVASCCTLSHLRMPPHHLHHTCRTIPPRRWPMAPVAMVSCRQSCTPASTLLVWPWTAAYSRARP